MYTYGLIIRIASPHVAWLLVSVLHYFLPGGILIPGKGSLYNTPTLRPFTNLNMPLGVRLRNQTRIEG